MPSEISEVTPGVIKDSDKDSAVKAELNPSFVSRSTMGGNATKEETEEME